MGRVKGVSNGPARSATSSKPEAAPFVDGFGGAEIADVLIDRIDVSDYTFQYRLEYDIHDLREAIRREGQIEPVDLTDSHPHRIIDGFRRIRAMTELGWLSV